MVRVSLFTNAFVYKLPIEEAKEWKWSDKMAEYIVKLGYDGVELSAKHHVDVEHILAGGAGEVKRIAGKHGLEITALASHYNHLDPDYEKRKKYNDRFRKVVEAASILDVPVVVTFSGMQYPFNFFYPYPESILDEIEKGWNEFREVWGPIIDHAGAHGVKIGIEVHFGQLAYNTQTAERMLKEIASKTLGLNLDPSHFVWQLIDPILVIEKFCDRIYHLHAKDVEFDEKKLKENGILATGRWGSSDRSWRFRVPGKGIIDWHSLIGALISKGYRGAISFEHEDPLVSLDEGAKEASFFLRKVLKDLGIGDDPSLNRI